MDIRKFPVACLSLLVIVWACSTSAQTTSFVSGPLMWTPVFQLREAGVDSNVFNSPTPQQDVTGGVGGLVDADLELPLLKLGMHGAAEYAYFERYKSQEGVNSNANVKATFPLTRFQPSVYGSFVRAKDRTTNEVDLRAAHHDYAYGAVVAMNVGQRYSVSGEANRTYVNYLHGESVAGVDIATQLNRRSDNVTSALRISLTPFTSVSFDGGFGVDQFDARPLSNTQNIRGTVSFNFSPDAVISGNASIGYHRMSPEHRQSGPGGALDFKGITSSVDLAYTLHDATRFGLRFGRDTNYSISTTTAYYVSTSGGLDISQSLPGPLTLLLRGTREQLAYPETELAPAHHDFVNLYGGGLQIAVSTNAHIALNYDFSNRLSGSATTLPYDRRHIYTTVTYGF